MATTARIVRTRELTLRNQIGVRRSRLAHQIRVIARTGIGILEQHGQRRTRSTSLIYTRYYLRQIGFVARSCTTATTCATSQILSEIIHRQRYARRHTVDTHTDTRAVRLAPNRYSKYATKAVHTLYIGRGRSPSPINTSLRYPCSSAV